MIREVYRVRFQKDQNRTAMNTEAEQLILEIYQDTTSLIKNTSYYLGLP